MNAGDSKLSTMQLSLSIRRVLDYLKVHVDYLIGLRKRPVDALLCAILGFSKNCVWLDYNILVALYMLSLKVSSSGGSFKICDLHKEALLSSRPH